MAAIQEDDGFGERIDVPEAMGIGDVTLENRELPKMSINENSVTDKSVVFGNLGNEIGNYDNDARQLLAIFPEEVWSLIAEKMDDPSDVESLNNSSLFFRELLLPQRVIFLFPKVWNILGRHFHRSQYELERAGEEDSSELDSAGEEEISDLKRAGGEDNADLESAGEEYNPDLESAGGEDNSDFESAGEEYNPDLKSAEEEYNSDLESAVGEDNSDLERAGEDDSSDLERAGEDDSSDLERTGEGDSSDLERAGEDDDSALERAGERDSTDLESSRSSSICSDCRKERPTKWYSDILTCRLVCQSWCDVIDKFYEDLNDSLSELYHDVACCVSSEWTGNQFAIDDRNDGVQQNLLHHFHQTHGITGSTEKNPFLGRSCFIYFEDEVVENPEGFHEILRILQKYGQHIWYCTIVNPDIFPTIYEWYLGVKNLLMLMPNLKNLYLARLPLRFYGRSTYGVWSPLIAQLAEQIDSNPLPELKNLERIGTQGLWTPVFKELIRIGKQITCLDIENDFTEQPDKEKYDLYSAELPNLKRLKIGCPLEDDMAPEVKVNWPLEKIKVDFGFENEDDDWRQIFHMLESNWAETLTNVTISLPQRLIVRDERDMEEWLSLRLQLPNVKKLRVEVKFLYSLDFTLPMKESLESLKISLLRAKGNPPNYKVYQFCVSNQIIQFMGEWFVHRRLQESNIWRLFPKLKTIRLDETGKHRKDDDKDAVIFTREEWQKVVVGN